MSVPKTFTGAALLKNTRASGCFLLNINRRETLRDKAIALILRDIVLAE